ncbi:unnamed protein product [Caenorhabditis sp. 36 PRJEB53466]|nr:unnamed protein product [Caenorhabditis sp. 36 PRJEB53466]
MQPFFVPNISDENDPIHFECDDSFDANSEVLKYFVQFLYLCLGAYLNSAILYTLLIKQRETLLANSFFVLFAMDSGVSLTLILTDVCFARLFIYFTPLCPALRGYFASPLLAFKLVMIVIHHSKVCKSVLQSLLVLNRMTCVLVPIRHSATWRRSLPYLVPFVVLLPLTVDWNLVISRAYMMPTYGGFWVNYIKKVAWATQSRFQLFFLLIALAFTVICTSVTLYTLVMLPNRLRGIERSITIATALISAAFTTILFSFFSYNTIVTSIFALNNFVYDFLNVGSPIVMLGVSKSVRQSVFSWKKRVELRNSQIFPVSVTSTI